MGKGNIKRQNRIEKRNRQQRSAPEDPEDMATIKPEEVDEILRELNEEPPKIGLDRGESKAQKPATNAYYDASSSKASSAGKPSLKGELDSVTDRSTSPFEIVYDEATRDMIRTPSPERNYPKPEELRVSNGGVESQEPISEPQKSEKDKKGKGKMAEHAKGK